jgi:hypothetical protein
MIGMFGRIYIYIYLCMFMSNFSNYLYSLIINICFMLISPGMHADENDKIEVLDASDSRKLNNIPEGKRVIA